MTRTNCPIEHRLFKETLRLSERTIEVEAPRTVAEPTTFQEARESCGSLVFRYVSRRIRPVEEAEDVTAEVFLDAYRHWQRLRGSPRLWLLGIARRKVADAYRRRRKTLAQDSLNGPMDRQWDLLETAAEARQALGILFQLPADERDALMMQILEQMSIDEIAQVLGRSTAAANSLLQRARGRVRRLVKEPLPGRNQP